MQKPHLIAVLAIISSLFCAACDQASETYELRGEAWGTTYQIKIVADASDFDEDQVRDALSQTLVEVDDRLSNWNSQSEVSRFNAHSIDQPFRTSAQFSALMDSASLVHDRSEGFFDVTLAPVIELWGFGSSRVDPSEPIVAPAQEDIASAMAQVGQQSVLAHDPDARTLRKIEPGATVFLSALAKGAGIDAIHATLEALGIDNCLIEVGGDLIAVGPGPRGDGWQIAIEQPRIDSRQAGQIVSLSDLAMATSGDYRNYYEIGGVRYSHIINPKTGKPITHRTASVTVLSDKAVLADAWATALLAAGKERGLAIAERENIAALFISRSTRNDKSQFESVGSSAFERLRNKP